MMVWIFLAVMTFLLASVLMTDEPLLNEVLYGHAFRNSPFVVMRLYGMTAVFGCLMVAAFVNSAATRDFACDTWQLIYTKPITKHGYLLGRFVAATLVSLIPMLGASLAVFISHAFSSGEQWGPTNWNAHLWSVLVIAIPNTLFVAAVVFAIAVWTRSTLASFVGILALMIGLSIAGGLATALTSEGLAGLVDPFGDTALANMTKYWTTAEKNTQLVPLTGTLLWNRLIWLGVSTVIFAAAWWRFSFAQRGGWITNLLNFLKSEIAASRNSPSSKRLPIPQVGRSFGFPARLRQLATMFWSEVWATAKSPVFICLVIGAVITVSASLAMRKTLMFGLGTIPVTINMTEIVRDSLVQIQIALITFYAGVFVWKERDSNLDEVHDALPIPDWLPFVSKSLALLFVVLFVVATGTVCSLLYQAGSGYFNFQVDVYFQELFLISMVHLICLMVLAVLCHVVSPNKYVGYFSFVALVVANAIAWPMLGVESKLLQYGTLPGYVYSDMFGREPYAAALRWFSMYWLLFAALLAIVSILLWQRGKERGIAARTNLAAQRWQGGLRWASIGICLAVVACGSWIYWNTQILNDNRTAFESELAQVNYEKEYASLADLPQPRVLDIRYDIDLFPKDRRLALKGEQTIANQHDEAISTIVVTTLYPFESTVEIEGAKLESYDEELGLMKFAVEPVMAPGDQREMKFTVDYDPVGFENSLQVNQIVQNGTFFNSFVCPQIGYQSSFQISDIKKRKRHGLSASRFAPLDPENMDARRNSYLSSNSDWVTVETVISTSGDQVAVAPGSLLKVWKKDGRKFFHYKLDHPSANFYSFASGRYKIAMRQWRDVDVEVYYHPDHSKNVDLMLRSVRKSLEYYSEAFGPYRHEQARIVEFPRVAEFAQAFPGTMPYSEGVGFIADLQDPNDVDMVFYVVAHEVAHQWWAHQVVGANMRGSTVLSETLSQYSALMVMEKEYGRDMMRKFLRYEMDNYLRARGRVGNKETPLKEVDFYQGFVHYNKGSVAMYHLKETIGEENVNAALRSLVDKFGYSEPPYPTSVDLVEALRAHTPPEHHGLLVDLFDNITLFANRTVDAKVTETDDDKFEVTLEVEFVKVYADEDGNEHEVALDDWIEIGAFAKPESGSNFGETLHRERIHATESMGTFKFTVDQKPHLVGVDPFNLLIDRNPNDNMKTPTDDD